MVQAQAMTAQANWQIARRPLQQVSNMVSLLKDFTQIEPPTFYGSKVHKDPRGFIDKVYKILYTMGVYSSEKAGLATYLLKDVAQTLYVQWRDNRTLRGLIQFI